MGAHLERWDNFGLREVEKEPEFSVTTRVLKFVVGFDIFYDLYWGLSLEYQRLKNHYLKPEDAETFLVDADLAKTDAHFGFNIIYHLM